MRIDKKYIIDAINNVDKTELECYIIEKQKSEMCLECDKLYTCDNNYDKERVKQCIEEKEVNRDGKQ